MSIKKYKILILENDKMLLEMYQAKMEYSGFLVIGFNHLPNNLTEIVIKEQPNLIILDMGKPDKSDSEIIKFLNEDPLTKEFLVVSLTDIIQKEINGRKQKDISHSASQYFAPSVYSPSNVVIKIKNILGIPIYKSKNIFLVQKEDKPKKSSNNGKVPRKEINRTALKSTEKRKIILHFEDDLFLVKMYATKFKKAGFKYINYVSPTNNPVQIVKKDKPDLIIMSILMPILDGFAATELIKADKTTKNIPLIILTNIGQKAEMNRGLALGAKAFLNKSKMMPNDVMNEVFKMFGMPITPKESLSPLPTVAWHGPSIQDQLSRSKK